MIYACTSASNTLLPTGLCTVPHNYKAYCSYMLLYATKHFHLTSSLLSEVLQAFSLFFQPNLIYIFFIKHARIHHFFFKIFYYHQRITTQVSYLKHGQDFTKSLPIWYAYMQLKAHSLCQHVIFWWTLKTLFLSLCYILLYSRFIFIYLFIFSLFYFFFKHV